MEASAFSGKFQWILPQQGFSSFDKLVFSLRFSIDNSTPFFRDAGLRQSFSQGGDASEISLLPPNLPEDDFLSGIYPGKILSAVIFLVFYDNKIEELKIHTPPDRNRRSSPPLI